ncbi:lethal giant larvae like, C-terminal-domain-containing protein [Infundibulicybe gibba]|nr:lethal giant larvae like, C-terminal-domain-containing protein [Infundibulicybe gibba]
MFGRHHEHPSCTDLSLELRDTLDWKVGGLRTFEYLLDIRALAIEPLSGILAIGTATGAIHLFGSPAVETRLTLPNEQVGVRFVQFGISSSNLKLICLDDNNQLYVWDISTNDRPRFLTATRFDQINSLTLSPLHEHIFVALNSGEIRTFDLGCLRKSPYTIPNMWAPFQQKMVNSGMLDSPNPNSNLTVETVAHPRDINLLFIAYTGGTARSTLRAYEFSIPPGAPGGLGYNSRDILQYRRPSVTTISIHPAGHFFSVGHTDGSISFWAVEDEDQPLFACTIDTDDINILDAEKLEGSLSPEGNPLSNHDSPENREPIFKLSWSGFPNSSDPRGGPTTLTILGGLVPGGPQGLTVLSLPAFNPGAPPDPQPEGSDHLHPSLRSAMRDSVKALRTYFYETSGVIQDYLLVPRSNPHYTGTFDPTAILLLVEGMNQCRTVEAYQFPPPAFLAKGSDGSDPDVVAANSTRSPEALAENLASILESLEIDEEPQVVRLPVTLSYGNSGVIDGQLVKLERDVYQTLMHSGDASPQLELKGGVAWADEAQANEIKLAKYQPHRVLITHHLDLTIHFSDLSAQLLANIPPTPLDQDFPKEQSTLTIDLNTIFNDAAVVRTAPPELLKNPRVGSVHLAPEALEVAIAMRSGEVVTYRLSAETHVPYVHRELKDKELVLLDHLTSRVRKERFAPYFLLIPGRGPVMALSLSDIGFLAVGYADGSLLVMDMRIPSIIFRHEPNKKSKTVDAIINLIWTISPLQKGFSLSRLSPTDIIVPIDRPTILHPPHCSPRLWECPSITISRLGNGQWDIAGDPAIAEAAADPLPYGGFVLDSKTGVEMKADRSRMSGLGHGTTGNVIYVTAGAKGARCFLNITGERVGRVEWGKVGGVCGVQVVERMGSRALVVLTDRHNALIYSLPYLNHLHTLQLPTTPSLPPSLEPSGDFTSFSPWPGSSFSYQAIYGTLFDFRRAYSLPRISFAPPSVMPPQPKPVNVGPTSILGSWFRFGGEMSGKELDALRPFVVTAVYRYRV